MKTMSTEEQHKQAHRIVENADYLPWAYVEEAKKFLGAGATVHELLISCPEEQIVRLKNAWKEAAAGAWKEAAHWLRNAAKDGKTAWHVECSVLAIELENK